MIYGHFLFLKLCTLSTFF